MKVFRYTIVSSPLHASIVSSSMCLMMGLNVQTRMGTGQLNPLTDVRMVVPEGLRSILLGMAPQHLLSLLPQHRRPRTRPQHHDRCLPILLHSLESRLLHFLKWHPLSSLVDTTKYHLPIPHIVR